MLARSRNRPMIAALQRWQFIPCHGHRHAQSGSGARGERSCRRCPVPVAQVVDIDLADPIGRPALGDEARRDDAGKVLHDGFGEAFHGFVVELGRDGHDNVQPFASTGLEPGLQFQLLQERMHQHRSLLDMSPRCSIARVEVQNEPIGCIDLLLGGVPGMELDDVHLCGPCQCLGAANLEQRIVTRPKGGVHVRHTGDGRALAVLLEEQLTVNTCRTADERTRPTY